MLTINNDNFLSCNKVVKDKVTARYFSSKVNDCLTFSFFEREGGR
jgi:hypothetical protein